MLDKTYRPAEVEARLYARWEDSGAFSCGRRPAAEPYAIVIPPPNVTGSLHMGHALNSTMQDVLIRFERMRGRDALWQPGTDHAGIATQMVVERQLEAENLTRHDVGREAFIERVWKWKEESGGVITQQLRRLGSSCDWPRERFTMDDGLSAAVGKVFVDLYKQGLIYRDKRLVNWDPKLHTAISDLEVEQREVTGQLWYFKYPIEGRDGEYITVATTRPETMLGDTAVAVHPDDGRYRGLVGQTCTLPIVGRSMPIIADEYVNPEKGTGAVKMTPAHDFNDFEVGRRHDLDMVNIFDRNARISFQGNVGFLRGLPVAKGLSKTLRTLDGLDRYEARDKVVAEMERLGLLDKVEENLMTVPYGDRSGVAIEPWLTDQWFVDAATLAKPAIEAVEDGRTRFVPKRWENTYFEWMRNIQPWCVSRQIWWGHQIPAWYGRKELTHSGGKAKNWALIDDDPEIFVAATEAEAVELARQKYGCEIRVLPSPPEGDFDPVFDQLEGEPRREPIWRDEDVLDTWFSSALWPFSTLGWPEETPEVERYYPTDVLVTGFDIIFFWVARMMMMGLHFMDDVPFHTVYIHALVRDESGQKMSKSKGNIIDPLELIETYGTDALRFTLMALAAPGRDVKLSAERVAGYRNFATKLWNAARFTQISGCAAVPGFDPARCRLTVNRWIVGKVAECAWRVTEALEAFKFNEAAGALYQFTWGTYCDWYLEFTKPVLDGGDDDAIAETKACTAWVLERLLHLLHPLMPFITEALWEQTAPQHDGMLIAADWPEFAADLADPVAEEEMDWVVRLISGIRSVRSEMNVPPGATFPLLHRDAAEATRGRLATHGDLIERLARVSGIEAVNEIGKGAVQVVVDEATYVLPLADVIDVSGEKARLEKEIAKLETEIAKFDKKLANQGFLAKAPAEVVGAQRERREKAAADRARRTEALERLAAM